MASARAEDIGTTAAVIPATRGRPAGGDERVLTLGTRMTREEKVVTDAAGSPQILFTDGWAITIGPSSSLVLERYVFDPRTNTVTMAVSLGRGALRFVGGKISKSETVSIETPLGTVGIRGGVARVEYSVKGRRTARLLYGDFLTVLARGTVSTTTRVGTVIDVPQGTPPSGPRAMSSSEVSQPTALPTTPAASVPSVAAPSTSSPASGSNASTMSSAIEAAVETTSTAIPTTSFSAVMPAQGGIASGQQAAGSLPSSPIGAPIAEAPGPTMPIRRR